MAARAQNPSRIAAADGQSAVTVRSEVPLAERLADPAPLGLAGFAMATMMLNVINVGWVAESATPVVLGIALAYGGLTQFAAGMWGFVKRDTFAAVAFTSYGAFWISFWALNAFFFDTIPPGEQASALGLYLICWAIFSGYMLIASLRVSIAVALVFATLVPSLLLLGLGESSDSTGLFQVGGAFGIATAAIAWYTSFAIVANRTFGRELVPVGHIGEPGDAK
jgi:uncharacterized protein